MTEEELNDIVLEFCGKIKHKIVNKVWSVDGLTILHIRDYLMVRGEIAFEDINNQVYVAYIGGGFLKKNIAIAGFLLKEGELTLSIHSEERFINQHTNEGIISEIERAFWKYIK